MSAPAAKTLRVVVLISGGGTTLRNLLDQIAQRGLPLQVVGVISSNPNARGLEYATAAGISTSVHERRTFATDDAYSEAIFNDIRIGYVFEIPGKGSALNYNTHELSLAIGLKALPGHYKTATGF